MKFLMHLIAPPQMPRLVVYVLQIALSFGAAAARADELEHYDVKAAYLLKLAAFVDWPSETFPTSTSPLTLCIAGRDPFGSDLYELATKSSAQHRPIAIHRMANVERLGGCHILFMAAETTVVEKALAAASQFPVLTVTEIDSENPGPRGIINFVTHNDRVKFQIDKSGATRSGLTLSAKLLSLSVSQPATSSAVSSSDILPASSSSPARGEPR